MATLIAPDMPSPAEDAETIKKACLGLGTDEKAIISVLAHRTATQRKLIRLAYEQIYREDLIHQLKSELSGHFEKAICTWVLDPADRDAVLANIAIEKAAPDYKALIEIACVRSPEELVGVKRAYKSRFKRSIEEDVASHATGSMRKLLVALISSFRYDGNEVNERLAYREAYNLNEEIQSNPSSYFEEVVRVLSTRSKPQLRATFNHYKDISGTSITKSMKDNPESEFSAALRLTVRCIKNPKKFLEKVLRNAINGLGTDEDALSRVIVTRAEVDLKEIKELYFKRNNVPLDQAVANDTSGDYRDFLLALLGSHEF